MRPRHAFIVGGFATTGFVVVIGVWLYELRRAGLEGRELTAFRKAGVTVALVGLQAFVAKIKDRAVYAGYKNSERVRRLKEKISVEIENRDRLLRSMLPEEVRLLSL